MTRMGDPEFKLRLPPALKKTLQLAAKENHRTLSAEIVLRLEVSVKSRTQALVTADYPESSPSAALEAREPAHPYPATRKMRQRLFEVGVNVARGIFTAFQLPLDSPAWTSVCGELMNMAETAMDDGIDVYAFSDRVLDRIGKIVMEARQSRVV